MFSQNPMSSSTSKNVEVTNWVIESSTITWSNKTGRVQKVPLAIQSYQTLQDACVPIANSSYVWNLNLPSHISKRKAVSGIPVWDTSVSLHMKTISKFSIKLCHNNVAIKWNLKIFSLKKIIWLRKRISKKNFLTSTVAFMPNNFIPIS